VFYSCVFLLVLYFRFVCPLTAKCSDRPRKTLRSLALAALLLPILVALAQWLVYGRYYIPEYGETLFCVKMLFEMTLLALAYAVLLRDGLNLVAWGLRRLMHLRFPLRDWASSGRGAVYLVLFAAVFLFGGLHQGLKAPVVTQTRVALPDLPRAFEGLRLAQLSDIHLYAFLGKRELSDVVDCVNREEPDLVVLSGDIANGAFERRREALGELTRLKAPLGVWGCEGNHEHYRDYAAYEAYYRSLGIRWLKNEHGLLVRAGEKLAIAGLADLQAEAMGRELPNSAKALYGISGIPAIVLFHQPSLARRVARNRDVILMLSGHTHAGQVLGIDRLAQLRSRGYLAGLYAVTRGEGMASPMRLYVHAGTYLMPSFPLRWGTRGEIAILTLTRQAAP